MVSMTIDLRTTTLPDPFPIMESHLIAVRPDCPCHPDQVVVTALKVLGQSPWRHLQGSTQPHGAFLRTSGVRGRKGIAAPANEFQRLRRQAWRGITSERGADRACSHANRSLTKTLFVRGNNCRDLFIRRLVARRDDDDQLARLAREPAGGPIPPLSGGVDDGEAVRKAGGDLPREKS